MPWAERLWMVSYVSSKAPSGRGTGPKKSTPAVPELARTNACVSEGSLFTWGLRLPHPIAIPRFPATVTLH